jgi:hypothetical protein
MMPWKNDSTANAQAPNAIKQDSSTNDKTILRLDSQRIPLTTPELADSVEANIIRTTDITRARVVGFPAASMIHWAPDIW